MAHKTHHHMVYLFGKDKDIRPTTYGLLILSFLDYPLEISFQIFAFCMQNRIFSLIKPLTHDFTLYSGKAEQ